MNYLLIDGNAIGFAAQDAKKLTIGDEEVQAVYGFIRSIQKILRSYPNYKPIILWDGKAKWRFELFPLYKGNRETTPEKVATREAYRSQKPKIMQAMTSLGVMQILDPNAEADDLAGYFARKLSQASEHNQIVLITGDRDWCQLVDKNVSWRDTRSDARCDHSNFEEFTKFKTPELFLEAKCIVGDTSDNVPGIGGIGKDTVGEFLNRYASIDGFLKEMSEPATRLKKLPAAHQRLLDNGSPKASSKYGAMAPMQDAYKRNMELMQLDGYFPKKSELKIVNGKFELNKFTAFCEDMLFRSILIQMNTWITPFEKLAGVS